MPMSNDTAGGDVVTGKSVRQLPFAFEPAARHWNSGKPEFSHIVFPGHALPRALFDR